MSSDNHVSTTASVLGLYTLAAALKTGQVLRIDRALQNNSTSLLLLYSFAFTSFLSFPDTRQVPCSDRRWLMQYHNKECSRSHRQLY